MPPLLRQRGPDEFKACDLPGQEQQKVQIVERDRIVKILDPAHRNIDAEILTHPLKGLHAAALSVEIQAIRVHPADPYGFIHGLLPA